MNTRKLIESDKTVQEILETTIKEKKGVGEPVTAMEGDEVRLKDGKEYQLFGHPWYQSNRDPIAIATGQETIMISDGGREREVPITQVDAVMSYEDGDRNLRRVKYVENDYGESELVYTE